MSDWFCFKFFKGWANVFGKLPDCTQFSLAFPF